MDYKKKILLGSKDILSRNVEDMFINLNLNSNFNEIRDGSYENTFDVSAQFTTERNSSRDFRIYGTIDSTHINCDNLTLYAYSSAYSGTGADSGTTYLSGLVSTFNSTALAYSGLNIYNHSRGKYLLSLTGYTNEYIYIKIPSDNLNYADQVYAQQLIFYDADGNFVDYGTKTIEIDDNGNLITIDNDFYFLYNKHWVKLDLPIVQTMQNTVSFSASSTNVTIPESNTPNFFFNVVLNNPSPFGLETVNMSMTTSSNYASLVNVQDLSGNSVNVFGAGTTLSFAKGEQVKQFQFFLANDTTQKATQNFTLNLQDFNYVQTASPLTLVVNVTDSTPRNSVTLNFQDIYQNRNYFTGIEVSTPPSLFAFIATGYSYPMQAVLRNGLQYEGTPMEFYPSDNYSLSITNIGSNTILPANTILGITTEQNFSPGQTINFPIKTQYQNIQKHSITFSFDSLTASTTTSNINSYNSGFTINGIPIFDYYKNYKVDYIDFLSSFNNTLLSNVNISGWNRFGLEMPFTITETNTSAQTITITANSPGTRLDIGLYGWTGSIFDNSAMFSQSVGVTATTIQPFIYSAQNPLQIVLAANCNSNLGAQYEFSLTKNGYKPLLFNASILNADTGATPYYLVSGYGNIVRNLDGSGNPIYLHRGVTSNWVSPVGTAFSSSGLYTSGDAYVNGILFLADEYFDNTLNTGIYTYGSNQLNLTSFGSSVGYTADFLPAPINTILQTSSYYSPQTSSQSGYLTISEISTPPSNVTSQRSFDFQFGTSQPNTYYFYNFNFYNSADAFNGSSTPPLGIFFSSGGTAGTNYTTYPALSLETYMVFGTTSYGGITPQAPLGSGMFGGTGTLQYNSTPFNLSQFECALGRAFSPNDLILLQSEVPGTPFSISNVVELQYTSGPLSGKNYVNNTIQYFEIHPNEIAGITINKANNFMGGYAIVEP